MKSTIPLGVVLFAVASVAATTISSCAQMCISNMIAKASELGCSATDIPCLCKNPDFANGLHDCTVEACGGADYPAVQAYGASYCASAASNSGSAGTATDASGKTTIVGTVASTTGVTLSNAESKTNGSSATVTGSKSDVLIPVTTEAKFSTIISGSVTSLKSLGNTTIYSTAPPSLGATGTNGTTPASTSGASGSSGSGSSGSGSSGSNGSGSNGSGSNSTAKSSSSSAAAHPLATVASGAAGVIGLAALLIL